MEYPATVMEEDAVAQKVMALLERITHADAFFAYGAEIAALICCGKKRGRSWTRVIRDK